MTAIALVVAGIVVFGLGFAAGGLVARARVLASPAGDAAVRAALGAALAERDQTRDAVVRDRERVVESVVQTATQLVGVELDARLAAGSRELSMRHERFDERVQRLDEGLVRLHDLVGALARDRAAQHGEVVQRLDETARAATALHRTTQRLSDALASPKSRGQWGERMADDVLRAAGFVEGVNYRRQRATASGSIPDVTFLLPDGLELNMDVKFPVDNYLRFLDADDERGRDAYRAQFLRDVRARIGEITTRDYIDPAHTVDHVLCFIPNESVYAFVHEHDPHLLDHALAKKVVLCSPSTLFAVLAVVRQAMASFSFERASGEILECLNRFSRQWTKFAEQLDKVGKRIDELDRAFDDLSGTRRRMLERELDRVEVLRSQAGDGDGGEGGASATAGGLDADTGQDESAPVVLLGRR